jgi:hypothetical protein
MDTRIFKTPVSGGRGIKRRKAQLLIFTFAKISAVEALPPYKEEGERKDWNGRLVLGSRVPLLEDQFCSKWIKAV